MNFAVNLMFLIKALFLHEQNFKYKEKLKYIENKKSFENEIKSIFIIFNGLLMKHVTQFFLSPTLRAIIWYKNEKDSLQALRSFLNKVLCNRMVFNTTMLS